MMQGEDDAVKKYSGSMVQSDKPRVKYAVGPKSPKAPTLLPGVQRWMFLPHNGVAVVPLSLCSTDNNSVHI